jgi:hypothetical protein
MGTFAGHSRERQSSVFRPKDANREFSEFVVTKPRGEKGGHRECHVNVGKLGTSALSARSGRSDIAQRPNIRSIGGVISARRSIANGTDSTSYRGEHTSASWRTDFEPRTDGTGPHCGRPRAQVDASSIAALRSGGFSWARVCREPST